MADIVALVFEPRAAALSQFLDYPLHVHKRVGKDTSLTACQVGLFPFIFPFAAAAGHAVKGEIDGAHVERGQFRLYAQGGPNPPIQGKAAAGTYIDDRVGRRFDHGQELQEQSRVARGFSRSRIAGVEMQNGRAGFGRLDGLASDVLGLERQVGRHGRSMNRPGDGAADDYFVIHGIFGTCNSFRPVSDSIVAKTMRFPSGSWTVSMEPCF